MEEKDFEYGLPVIVAGPCSAESESQVLAAAQGVAAAGARIFRAGLWKPRTRPGSFEGVGAEGLPWLVKARELTGLPVMTEIASGDHLRAVTDAGLDGVWLGARTTANPFAVQEIADAFAGLSPEVRAGLTVMVKNPVNPDLELWEGAFERLEGAGVRRAVAIHRGFSSYGEQYYRNSPMWRIPIELHRRRPGLPLLCDPSHIAGRRQIVADVSRHAIALGFDGLIIESHCDPENALSDSRQQITPSALKLLIESLAADSRKDGDGDTGVLDDYRRDIDALDTELMELLARRMAVAREIGRVKQGRGIPVMQPKRYKALIEKRISESERLKLDPDFVRGILAAIHEESVRQQLSL